VISLAKGLLQKDILQMTDRDGSVIRSITKYSSSAVYLYLLRMGNAFIKPKFLSPEMMGLWNLLSLITYYSDGFFDLGSRSSMRYLVPVHASRDEDLKNREIKGTVFHGILIINLFFVLLISLFAFHRGHTRVSQVGLITMAIQVLLSGYYCYYLDVLKAEQQFGLISSSNYLFATLSLIFNLIFVSQFSIYGVYVSTTLSLGVILLYFRHKYPLGPLSGFHPRIFVGLAKMGIPIIAFDMLLTVLRTSDRVIIPIFLDKAHLGYYTIATLACSFLSLIPSAAREVIEQRLMANLHRSSEEDVLREYLFTPLAHAAYLMPFLIGPTFFMVPLFVTRVLPQYVPAVVPTQILLFGCYFLAMAYVTRGVIVAQRLQTKGAVIMAFTILFNVGLNALFLRLGWGLEGVAISTSISYGALFISLLLFLRRNCSGAERAWATTLETLLWPFLVMAGLIFLLQHLSRAALGQGFLAAFCCSGIYCLLTFLWIDIASRKYLVLSKIRFTHLYRGTFGHHEHGAD
jgi:O-antigen/teichoic acid export membrane protein